MATGNKLLLFIGIPIGIALAIMIPYFYVGMMEANNVSLEVSSGEELAEYVSIVAVGDSIGYNINPENLSHLPELIESDIFIFNLEGVLREGEDIQDCSRLPNQSLFTSSPSFARYMKLASINIANLANNHILDCGFAGIEDTRKFLREHQIMYVGAGRNLDEACEPLFVEIKQMKIAFLSYNFVQYDLVSADDSSAGAATLDRCTHDYDSIASEADIVVASIHLGTWSDRVNKKQLEIVNSLFDLGVDVVIGHSPHMPQAVMEREGKIAFFSLGNFIFRPDYEMRLKAHTTIMPKIDLYDDRTYVTIYPIRIDDSGIPYLDHGSSIISEIVDDSRKFNVELIMKENLGYFSSSRTTNASSEAD